MTDTIEQAARVISEELEAHGFQEAADHGVLHQAIAQALSDAGLLAGRTTREKTS